MKYLLIMFCLILSACGENPVFVPVQVRPDFVKTYNVFGANTGKRVILAHGVWSDATFWNEGYALSLRQGLQAQGYQVVTFTYPVTNGEIFNDGGSAYRQQYADFLQWMFTDLDATQGAVTRTDIGGFSFGGLHAMMAVSLFPAVFTKWFGLCPVANPNFNPEIFGHYDAPMFNAFNYVPVLQAHAGFIQTSLHDNILGYQNGQNLSTQIGNNFYMQSVSGILHDFDAQVVTSLLNWI